VEPRSLGGHQANLVALSSEAAPSSRRRGDTGWGHFSSQGARPFGAAALSTPWWGGRRVPGTSDGHPLPGVELRVVSLASMEGGGKALSAALRRSPLARYAFGGRFSRGGCRRRARVAWW
jgi:hypothetical protein